MVTQLVATEPERIVMDYLKRNKIDFQFQTSLAGGFYSLGGAVVDFLVEPNLAWRVMGLYWHRGVSKSGADTIQKEMLMSLGYVVVDLWESDLKDPARLEQTMRLALQGIEMLQ